MILCWVRMSQTIIYPFEIYPKRNWYYTASAAGSETATNLKYILKGIDTPGNRLFWWWKHEFEIYPKRNWYGDILMVAQNYYMDLKYILKGIDTILIHFQYLPGWYLKYILKGIDTICTGSPSLADSWFEIYPKRNWYIIWRETFFINRTVFEIYPKRNWYVQLAKWAGMADKEFEIYPKRNWYKAMTKIIPMMPNLKYILKGIDTYIKSSRKGYSWIWNIS